jgi:hypothetical protein
MKRLTTEDTEGTEGEEEKPTKSIHHHFTV